MIRSATAIVGLAALAAGIGLAASPARGGDTGSTTASVVVSPAITLSGLTPSFSLAGDASSTVTGNEKVGMTVTTNNLTGYRVSVQSAAAQLSGTGTNTDTIPITNLKVRKTGDTVFAPVTNVAALPVATKLTMSAAGGDLITNDFSIDIPFVAADTYSVALNYVASTQ